MIFITATSFSFLCRNSTCCAVTPSIISVITLIENIIRGNVASVYCPPANNNTIFSPVTHRPTANGIHSIIIVLNSLLRLSQYS